MIKIDIKRYIGTLYFHPLHIYKFDFYPLVLIMFISMHSTERKYKCLAPDCTMAFSRPDALNRHLRSSNPNKVSPCHAKIVKMVESEKQAALEIHRESMKTEKIGSLSLESTQESGSLAVKDDLGMTLEDLLSGLDNLL